MNDLTESYKTLKWHLFWAFSIATVTFFLLMDRSINVYDEGVILTGAMRVLNGEMIHRDFYANYGPANFYLLAWMFKLFGSTIFVERMLDLIIRAAIVVSVFHIISQSCNSRYATIGSLLVGLWLASVGNYGYPVYPALLLALLSVQMLIHFTTNNQQDYHLFIAGIFTGLCAFFRYDIGFLVMVANIASITYIHTFLEKLPNH